MWGAIWKLGESSTKLNYGYSLTRSFPSKIKYWNINYWTQVYLLLVFCLLWLLKFLSINNLKRIFFWGGVIYLFTTVLGLRFCARAFCSCGKWGPLFIAVRGPLTIAASLFAEHRYQTRRLSIYGSRAQLLRGMWDLPRPGLEPVSPALAGRLSTTAPPGKPSILILSPIF